MNTLPSGSLPRSFFLFSFEPLWSHVQRALSAILLFYFNISHERNTVFMSVCVVYEDSRNVSGRTG